MLKAQIEAVEALSSDLPRVGLSRSERGLPLI